MFNFKSLSCKSLVDENSRLLNVFHQEVSWYATVLSSQRGFDKWPISMYKFLRFCYKTDNLSISSGPYMYEVTLVGTFNIKGSIEDLVLIRLH